MGRYIEAAICGAFFAAVVFMDYRKQKAEAEYRNRSAWEKFRGKK